MSHCLEHSFRDYLLSLLHFTFPSSSESSNTLQLFASHNLFCSTWSPFSFASFSVYCFTPCASKNVTQKLWRYKSLTLASWQLQWLPLLSPSAPPFSAPFSVSLQLQSVLRVNVSQVQVDECVRADCRAAGGCSTHLSISDSPTLVDSGGLSLVSVKVISSAVCGCAAREATHQPCSSYPSNPCLNGGTCIDTQNGYRWDTPGVRGEKSDCISRKTRNGRANKSQEMVMGHS